MSDSTISPTPGAQHGLSLTAVILAPLTSDEPGPRFVATLWCALLALIGAAVQSVSGSGAAAGFVIACFAFGGAGATASAWEALKRGAPDVNFLMIFAAAVSALLGHWGEGAILLFLFSLSDALERYALERTRRGVTALMDLRPKTAARIRDGVETRVPVESVEIGDELRVRPGERFPVDGDVIEGTCAADEAVLTGESELIEKAVGDAVFAGTINTNGSLRMRVTKVAGESSIARIVRLVREAQESKPAAQRTIERWQTPYVFGVLGITAITVLVRYVAGGSAAEAVRAGMVLLVAASPCAVVLASPVAVLAAVTRGARVGVLFKGGVHLERLADVDTIAFDKTGTLTEGRPVVEEIIPAEGVSRTDVLRVAAAVELHSEHPLARAIVAAAKQENIAIPPAVDFEHEAGGGVLARVEERETYVGRPDFFVRRGVTLPAALADAHVDGTPVFVVQPGGIAGLLVLRDRVRPQAASGVRALHAAGIKRLSMLTGDHRDVARRVAEKLEIDDVRAGLRPQDKLEIIRLFGRDGATVAMVGDGVNDAPALAAAGVGIAMGGVGSDVALETADVVLMREDLRRLADAVHLARRCRATIRISLGFAFAMIAVLIAATLSGWLTLPIAVIGHEGSTVIVVLNGLSLLRTRLPSDHFAT